MKVAVVVHTQSGNTGLLAKAVAAALQRAGHTAEVDLLRPVGRVKPRDTNVEFRRLPEVADCDALLVGGPVWAFSASPAAMAYINTLANLKGKRCLAFVTHGLPFRFLGADRAVRSMSSALEFLGAEVLPGFALGCGGRPKPAAIDAAAAEIARRVSA